MVFSRKNGIRSAVRIWASETRVSDVADAGGMPARLMGNWTRKTQMIRTAKGADKNKGKKGYSFLRNEEERSFSGKFFDRGQRAGPEGDRGPMSGLG